MKRKIILISISTLSFSSAFAEGQSALDLLMNIAYVMTVLFYTLVGYFIVKAFARLFKCKRIYSNWFYAGIAFVLSLIVVLALGEDSVPFFWGVSY